MTAKNTVEIDAGNRGMIDSFLTYLTLAEKKDWNVPDLNYYDDALMSISSQMAVALAAFRGAPARDGRRDGNKYSDDVINTAKSVRGAMILGPSGAAGSLYSVTGGLELDYVERRRILHLYNYQLPAPVDPFSTRVIEVRATDLFENGDARSLSRSYYYQKRQTWYPVKPESSFAGSSFESMALGVVAMWTAARRSTWSVSIRLAPGSPSVMLLTDPTGVREFFKFRDIGPGETRRAALRHWVTEHWRQCRDDPDAEGLVREHLRGRTSFLWGGMSADIHLPHSEEERSHKAVERRARLSSEKLDRRLRVLRLGPASLPPGSR